MLSSTMEERRQNFPTVIPVVENNLKIVLEKDDKNPGGGGARL